MRYIFFTFFCVACVLQGWSQQRPNILWITSEDNGPFLGCYGDEFATTPNLDNFAEQGILYENAFSTAPACAPSRSTLITGMFASSLGTEQMRSKYPIPDFVKFFPKYLREAGYYTTNNVKKDYNTVDQRDAWDESSHKATYKNRKPGQPFFSIFNLTTTHESRIHRARTPTTRHDPEQVSLPPYHPATPEMKYDWALYYDKVETMDEQVGKLLQELEEAGLAENTIVFYYSDHGGVIARSKRFIYESGLHVPLIIRVPEKYAAFAQDKAGSRTDRVVSFEDFAPTVLSLAGIDVPEYMEGKPFLGKQQEPEKEYAFAFRGRIDESLEFVRSIRNKKYRYVRNYMPHKIYGQPNEYLWQAPSIVSWETKYNAGVLNEVQQAFWNEKPTEELYNIAADPHNITNLAEIKAYTDILEEMRRDNREFILKTKDTGFIPESMKVNISKDGTIYDFCRSKNYPLKRILETAEMATTRDANYLKNLIKRLDDENSIVRYWAATGCTILGAQAKAAKAELIPLLKDSEPAVRIAAAEAIYGLGDKTSGLPVLTDILQHSDNLYARLEAVTVLESMGLDAKPALSAIKKMVEVRVPNKTKDQPSWKYDHDVKVARRIIFGFSEQAVNN